MIPVIFINCKKIDYIGKMISGEKKYETRHFNTLGSLVGRRVLFAETGNGTPKIRCSAILKSAEHIKYLGVWAMFRDETCVPENSEHDWDFKRPGKWIYELEDVKEQIWLPWKEGQRHGIVWMEYEPSPYRMVYDGDDFIDSIDHKSLESAICDAQDTLLMWSTDEMSDWKWKEGAFFPSPTKKQIENWDYMVYNSGCYVVEWDNESGEYTSIDDAVWPRDQKDLDELNWALWEDLEKKWREESK